VRWNYGNGDKGQEAPRYAFDMDE